MRITMKESFAPSFNLQVVGKPRVVDNNTFQYQRPDGSKVFRLHRTDIAVNRPDGKWELNTSGWKTPTTKDRLNNVTPYRVHSDKGAWIVSDGAGRAVPFHDGMVLPDAFDAPAAGLEQAEEDRKLKAQIKKFLTKTIVTGQPLPLPSDGDCWYCRMFDAEHPTGERGFSGWVSDKVVDRSQTRDTSHLLAHIEEGYMHGSLIVNAFRAAGYMDSGIRMIAFSSRPNYAVVRRVVSTYLKRRLGLATQ